MKIKSMLVGMLACTAMVSCTNDDVLEGGNNPAQNGERSYMAVNIVSANSGSRSTSTVTGDKYQDANEANEVKVGKVRFYFFDENGAAYKVTDKNNTNANYIEIENPKISEGSTANVDKKTPSVLVIEQSKVAPPKSVVAVLNSDKLATDLADEMSLAELTAKVCNDQNGIAGTGENEFIMTNSVYVDSRKETMVATPISIDDIQHSEDAAKANPVNIYVERVLAKVTTELKNQNKTDGYKPEDKSGVYSIGAEFGGKKVFAKINGWQITNYNDNSTLFKSLNDEPNFTWTWNAPADFRSFWANSADPTDGTTGNNASYKNPYKFNEIGSTNVKYCLENTSDNPTKLLVAATLLNEDGEALDIAQWMGVKYTVADLKTQLAGTLASEYFYFDESDKKYKSITAEHIDFLNPDNTWAANEKRYEVYACLAKGAPQFYTKKADGTGMNEVAASVINDKLDTYPVRVWTEGATYYYVNIAHLGGLDAVVRNHWYNISINSISGFGTPVYDGDDIIFPQVPDNDKDTYIAAEINILSWKVVSQDVELGQ